MHKYTAKLKKLSDTYQKTVEKQLLKEMKAVRLERGVKRTRHRIGSRVYYSRYADD